MKSLFPLIAIFVALLPKMVWAAEKPNIVYIICDDLGYGDVQCLAPATSKIPTPNADQLAKEGMVFSDAHSGSSVCSPTRYGIMTGRYSWRTRLQKGVVTGFAPSLIAAKRPTVASYLKQNGYHTAIIGKWHLDFEYLDPKTGKRYLQSEHKTPPVGAKIPDGPIHRGFDYYHGFHHARNMKAVIENDVVIAHDDEINMLPRLTTKSVEYIASRSGKEEPFFLYLPLGSPHTPILPTPQWQGKSGLGKYGDFVMQTDNVVGEVSKALQKHGFADNTLVIFTSDNGCSKAADIKELAAKGHSVSAHMRGSKADIWDGGHRIPFIVRWPHHVEPSSTSEQLICLTDLFATAGEILGKDIPTKSAEDSVSFLPALSSHPIQSTRAGVIHHSFSGHFAYRSDNWKLILAHGSGGWSSPNESQAKNLPEAQLYDLATDPGETKNLFPAKPEIAKQLFAKLEADVFNGRSTKGDKSMNDVEEIVLWKSRVAKKKNRTNNKPKKGKGKKKRPATAAKGESK
ncbi:MAG: arylsulfatase A [Pirellulaceae bacterium]|jgi:arylsulfatase A